MKILFFVPHLNTIYAGRTIYNGYKNAFLDLGHEFKFLTTDDFQSKVYAEYKPDILFTSMGSYIFKHLDLVALRNAKKTGMKVFVNTPFWKSPMSKLRINEAKSVSENKDYVELIKSGNFGDVFYASCEGNDPRMIGFTKNTGYILHTIPLAVDKMLNFYEFMPEFKSDISFLGTNLPGKRKFFNEVIYPLKRTYDVRFYGQDWTLTDKLIGTLQKIVHYFNLPIFKTIQKPKLNLEDERRIYSSTKISLNVHEDYQVQFGGDCNERTFKIPACGGFEIVDDVSCIKNYFNEGTEIVIAKDKSDWQEKIDYYISHPEERQKISKAGKKRVLADHTYHNRVDQLLGIYRAL